MGRLSKTATEILNELHTERLDYTGEYIPLIDAINKLAEYEDAEEQGLLVKLPCKIGDVVTIILSSIIENKKIVKQAMVSEFKVYKDIYLVVKPLERPDVPYEYYIDYWGKTIFSTLDEALAKMESEV